MSKKQSILLCGLFLLFLAVFSLLNLFWPDREFSEMENRTLASNPPFSFQALFSGTSTDYEYETGRFTYTEEEAAAKAKEELDSLLDGLEQKGVQISANHVKIGIQNGSCTAKGTLTVIEKTGQRVPSQILEQPAERTTDTDE